MNSRKRIEKTCLNCEKKVSRNCNSFCSGNCHREYTYKDYINKWKCGEVNGVSGQSDISNYIRRYLKTKYNNSCQKCSWSEVNINTGNVPIEIHHADGDYTNNKESNLELLCPNCHSLTRNYKSRGNNNKRTHR